MKFIKDLRKTLAYKIGGFIWYMVPVIVIITISVSLRDMGGWGLLFAPFLIAEILMYSVKIITVVYTVLLVIGIFTRKNFETKLTNKFADFGIILFILMMGFVYGTLLYSYIRIQNDEVYQTRKMERKANLEVVANGTYPECKVPEHEAWYDYLDTKKSWSKSDHVGMMGTDVFYSDSTDRCIERYIIEYKDILGRYVHIFAISDFNTKEELFKCKSYDYFGKGKLEINGERVKSKKSCDDNFHRYIDIYENGYDAYDSEGNVKDYDDFDDELLSKTLKEKSLQSTKCPNVFRDVKPQRAAVLSTKDDGDYSTGLYFSFSNYTYDTYYRRDNQMIKLIPWDGWYLNNAKCSEYDKILDNLDYINSERLKLSD